MIQSPQFDRYIGIDYSGAATPTTSLRGLRMYQSDPANQPTEIYPPAGTRKYWTRRGIAEWLAKRLAEDKHSLVGIDHGFSFPLQYFEKYGLPLDWPNFLEDFQSHWPADGDNTSVDFIRDGICGNGAARQGNSRWRRLAELRSRGAKSVFHFDVQGSVAKSTHSGLPWLLYLRRSLPGNIHFWPFDGWHVPSGKSAVAEIYPRLWNKNYSSEDRTPDQHDAFCTAAWMREADGDGSLSTLFHPKLTLPEQMVANIEGWILGIS